VSKTEARQFAEHFTTAYSDANEDYGTVVTLEHAPIPPRKNNWTPTISEDEAASGGHSDCSETQFNALYP
jgi:hypothetical protein